jgi:hypothetical protein
MNERILELAKQAGMIIGDTSKFDMAVVMPKEVKFAELIVWECIRACINEGRTFEVASAGEYSSNLYASAIQKHFGVEE